MRRIFPLLLILLLLCGCGGNRDAAVPENADRLVIFTARSAAAAGADRRRAALRPAAGRHAGLSFRLR